MLWSGGGKQSQLRNCMLAWRQMYLWGHNLGTVCWTEASVLKCTKSCNWGIAYWVQEKASSPNWGIVCWDQEESNPNWGIVCWVRRKVMPSEALYAGIMRRKVIQTEALYTGIRRKVMPTEPLYAGIRRRKQSQLRHCMLGSGGGK